MPRDHMYSDHVPHVLLQGAVGTTQPPDISDGAHDRFELPSNPNQLNEVIASRSRRHIVPMLRHGVFFAQLRLP